ncbi:MAG: hypothetical protein WBA97_03400 [Actinophytocola sp.]|uniref:hypothetical protein n=1 Tax=Actinophytocola sp. TaxID=1872138 RepID=UPI003C71757A
MLTALIEEYVLFAGRDAAYFQLMFRQELKKSHKSQQGEEAGENAFAVLDDTVEARIAAGTMKPVEERAGTDAVEPGPWPGITVAGRPPGPPHNNPEELTRQVAHLVTTFTAREEPHRQKQQPHPRNRSPTQPPQQQSNVDKSRPTTGGNRAKPGQPENGHPKTGHPKTGHPKPATRKPA